MKNIAKYLDDYKDNYNYNFKSKSHKFKDPERSVSDLATSNHKHYKDEKNFRKK